MTGRFVSTIAAGAVAAAGLFAADTADAGWHHYPTNSYFHAPYGGSGYNPYGYVGTTGSRYSLFGQNYGYSSYFSPPYSPYGAVPGYGVAPGYGMGYGAAPYGAVGRPHGELEYDVYTPYGRQEIEYKFRRNGRIDVDYDD
jgi:hypothetical protein